MIHFEIVSHRANELIGPPWNDARKRVEDTNANIVCDVPTLDRFLLDQLGDGIDLVDVLQAARQLRDVKVLHKSEWSLTSEEQIRTLVPHADRRRVLWPHMRRFSWVAEAIAANPQLQQHLGDGSGMFWHYHPITFMQHMNQLVAGENREIPESEYHDTNVELDEDDFITNFVRWTPAPAPARYTQVNVDDEPIRASFISPPVNAHDPNQAFTFTRRDISCTQAGPHAPGPTPAQSTRFSLALLELLERIRRHFNSPIDVALSYVCDAHYGNNGLCVLNDAADLADHHDGLAIDFQPVNPTAANCRSLWNSVVAVVEPITAEYAHLCGTPTQADFPPRCQGIQYHTSGGVEAKLRAHPQQVLTNAEAGAFRIHLGFLRRAEAAPGPVPSPQPVQLRVAFESIKVLNDQDWFGPGEWTMQARVNGYAAGGFSGREVDTGSVISVSWTKDVTIPRGGALHIQLGGYDEDLIWNDSLGAVSLRFDQNSSPPWGIGLQSATSSNGSFRVTLEIESLVSDDF